MRLKILAIISSFILLTACGNTPLEIVTKPLDRPELVLPETTPVILDNVNWVVITKDGKAYFALTPTDFQKFTLNIGKMQQYMIQQNSIIKAYKDYYSKKTTE